MVPLAPNDIESEEAETGLLKSPAVGELEVNWAGTGSIWGGGFINAGVSAVRFLNVKLRIAFLVVGFGGILSSTGATSFGRMGASAPCPRRCLVEMPWEAGISEGGITPRFAWSLLVPRLGIFFSLGKNLCGTFLLDSDISGDDGSENKDVGEWISTGDEHIS